MTEVRSPITSSWEEWGVSPNGVPIRLYRLRSPDIELRAMTFGGIITALIAPDDDGMRDNVVLAHRTAEPYFDDRAYLGAIVGRYANRIADARFRLDGAVHVLSANEGDQMLHGGVAGFNRQDWTPELDTRADAAQLVLSRVSGHLEEGFPGRLDVRVSYTLTAGGAVVIDYEARTDAPTVVSLTQHTYFNLSGGARRDVRDHELTIAADHFTPVGPGLLPTGELAPVDGTPFDFRAPARLRERLAWPDPQLAAGGGFDHNFVLTHGGPRPSFAARLRDPASGRHVQIETTEPGLQFYDGHLLGEAGFRPYDGLCLETQHFPDSPNHDSFPTTVLRSGDTYRSTTTWRFGTSRVHHAA